MRGWERCVEMDGMGWRGTGRLGRRGEATIDEIACAEAGGGWMEASVVRNGKPRPAIHGDASTVIEEE